MARDEKAGTAPRPGGSRRLGASRTAAPSGKGPAKGSGKGSGGGSRLLGRGGRRGRAKDPEARKAKRAARRARFTQLKTAFTVTRKADPRLVPLLAIAFLVPFAVFLLIGIAVGYPFPLAFLGLLAALVAMTAVFGRRVQRHAYTQVEGQLGAAAAVLQGMRGDWRVTPAAGFNREQDLVHRVLGRPGIVLVGEGSPTRVRSLITTEKRRLARFVGETPVYDVVVGDAEGQVPLRALEKHFVKLPRNIKPKDVNVLDRKLAAMAPALPIPKGPVPTSGRMPRGKVR